MIVDLNRNDVFYCFTWEYLNDEILELWPRLKDLKFHMSNNFFDLNDIWAAITKLLEKLGGLTIRKLMSDIDYKTMKLAFWKIFDCLLSHPWQVSAAYLPLVSGVEEAIIALNKLFMSLEKVHDLIP